MARKIKSKRVLKQNIDCKEVASQYIFFVTILASIISQEIDDNDDLDNLAGFLLVLGEQLAFLASIRDGCSESLNNKSSDIIDPELSIDSDTKSSKKVVKRVRKKVRKNSSR